MYSFFLIAVGGAFATQGLYSAEEWNGAGDAAESAGNVRAHVRGCVRLYGDAAHVDDIRAAEDVDGGRVGGGGTGMWSDDARD